MQLTQRSDWRRLPFPREEYVMRMNALQEGMKGKGLDGMVICGGPKRSGYIRYISNFESYIGTTLVLIPMDGSPVLVTDSTFRQQPMQSGIWTTWIDEVRWTPNSSFFRLEPKWLADEFNDALKYLGLTSATLGFVGEERLYPALYECLRSQIQKERWKDGTDIFHRVASIKSDAEVELFIRFGKIMDKAIEELLDSLKPGRTEFELLGIILDSLFRQGIQNLFGIIPPFFTSGDMTRFKNVPPSSRKIKSGDPVFFDLEPELDGYYLDIARSVTVGNSSTAIQRILEASHAIERELFEAIKPGVSMRSLQEVACSCARRFGLDKFYYFKFHGQGTMKPAYPFPQHLDFVLETGMVFTIESILLDPDITSGTIENAYLVTADGAKRIVEAGIRDLGAISGPRLAPES